MTKYLMNGVQFVEYLKANKINVEAEKLGRYSVFSILYSGYKIIVSADLLVPLTCRCFKDDKTDEQMLMIYGSFPESAGKYNVVLLGNKGTYARFKIPDDLQGELKVKCSNGELTMGIYENEKICCQRMLMYGKPRVFLAGYDLNKSTKIVSSTRTNFNSIDAWHACEIFDRNEDDVLKSLEKSADEEFSNITPSTLKKKEEEIKEFFRLSVEQTEKRLKNPSEKD